MIDFDFFDNIIEFFEELFILLKEDWIKFKLFVKENKKNLIWIFITLITLQITNIINIGNTCDKFYKNNNKLKQNGGGNAKMAASAGKEAVTANAKSSAAESEASKKDAAEASTKATAESSTASAASAASAAPEAGKEGNTGNNKSKPKEGDSESKDVQKKLDFFDKLKGKVTKATTGGVAGPVFGNLEGISNAIGGLFTVFATLLIICGVISLPVLIFIVITYCIIKLLVGKIASA